MGRTGKRLGSSQSCGMHVFFNLGTVWHMSPETEPNEKVGGGCVLDNWLGLKEKCIDHFEHLSELVIWLQQASFGKASISPDTWDLRNEDAPEHPLAPENLLASDHESIVDHTGIHKLTHYESDTPKLLPLSDDHWPLLVLQKVVSQVVSRLLPMLMSPMIMTTLEEGRV